MEGGDASSTAPDLNFMGLTVWNGSVKRREVVAPDNNMRRGYLVAFVHQSDFELGQDRSHFGKGSTVRIILSVRGGQGGNRPERRVQRAACLAKCRCCSQSTMNGPSKPPHDRLHSDDLDDPRRDRRRQENIIDNRSPCAPSNSSGSANTVPSDVPDVSQSLALDWPCQRWISYITLWTHILTTCAQGVYSKIGTG